MSGNEAVRCPGMRQPSREQAEPAMWAGRCGPAGPTAGPEQAQRAAGAAGQLIRTLSPESVDETWTSSARPVITARPNAAGKAASRVSAGTGWNGAPCPPLPADTVAVFITGANPPGSAPVSGGAASVTTTSNR